MRTPSTAWLNSATCSYMAPVSQYRSTKPAPLPIFGQIARRWRPTWCPDHAVRKVGFFAAPYAGW